MSYRNTLESKPLDLEVFNFKLNNPNLKVWIPISKSEGLDSNFQI